MGIFKRLAGAIEVKRRTVDHGGKLRSDPDIGIRRQTRYKRHADPDLIDRVFGFFGLIVKIDSAVDDFDIVEREARRRSGRTGRTGSEFVDQILKVILPVVISNHMDKRLC